jgi:hypothetical protein
MVKLKPPLHLSHTPDASIQVVDENSWHLEIPARLDRGYSLAQIDDHTRRQRNKYHWKPPLTLSLQARASAEDIPGTWGFGFWNDPFGFLLGYGGQATHLPSLPEAAWFFHASPKNYLSFRNDLPAQGFLAAIFKPKKVPPVLLALASPSLALTFNRHTAEVIRGVLRRFVQQDAASIPGDVTEWHTYKLDWRADQVTFSTDGRDILHTELSPQGPLSLVIWVDNQYASLPPGGRLRYGTQPNPTPVSLQVREFELGEPK